MRKNKLLLITLITLLSLQTTFASYPEIDCSTDPVFSENKCNQCFDGWDKAEWANIGLLTDVYKNPTANPKLIYKNEQSFPKMINLWWDKSSWSQIPWSDGFWEYTSDFESLYSSWQQAHVINPWKEVIRVKSKDWFAYKLDKNSVDKWWKLGLLIYPVVSHDLVNDEVSIDSFEHRECVLFKSWTPAAKTIEEQPIKQLPQTGPASILLLALALIIALWLFWLKNKKV